MKQLFRPNIWLLLLIILIAVNLYVLFSLNQLLNDSNDEPMNQSENKVEQSENQLILNPKIINQYLQRDKTDDLNMRLKGNTLAIRQKSRFLGQTIFTDIMTHPKVIGENRLKLEIDTVDVADLPFSKQQTLRIIKRFGNLPENVMLDAEKECFYYEMDPIKLNKNQLKLQLIDEKGWHFNLDIKEW